jgi:MraZ protein
MFRGVTAIQLDGKGRLTLPAKYRSVIQDIASGVVVVTIDMDSSCLLLYPLNEWEVIEKKLSALSSFNPATRRLQRLLIGHASEMELDAQGRFLLPQKLRDYAHFDKSVVMVGQGKKFEMWDENLWDKKRLEWLDEHASEGFEACPEELLNLSL